MNFASQPILLNLPCRLPRPIFTTWLWHNASMVSGNSSITSNRSLRDQVDELLPNWQSWYPSLFDAAHDLGILRARVCDLSSLVLSRRHASIYNEAVQAFREQWSVEEPEGFADTGNDSSTMHPHDISTDSPTSEY